MNILVLKPGRRILDYACLAGNRRDPVASGRLEGYRGTDHDDRSLVDALRKVSEACQSEGRTVAPEAVAFRVVYGGAAFRGPTLVDPEVVRRIRELTPQAPLHLPVIPSMIEACGTVFPNVPRVLVFETSFFADLPAREHVYGIDVDVLCRLGLRRFGFHGLFHEAAVAQVTRRWRQTGTSSSPRIISICMEPRPEVAAVAGHQPVMVTGGTTPLEGLPGYTTCGEMDPGIVLALSQKMGWGPEQIDRVLTQESGLWGLTGRRMTWDELFTSTDPELEPARQLILYRLLLACGAAVAAMGGLDGIVFSGRSAGVGSVLGPWLSMRLPVRNRRQTSGITWECFPEPLDRIIADTASAVLLGSSSTRAA